MHVADPKAVHFSSLVVDGHADTAQRFVDEGWDFTAALGGGMLNLETARAGGLDAEFFAIWVEPTEWRGRFAHRALQLIDSVREQVRRHPDKLLLGTGADDLLRAKSEGRFCALLGLEGGHAIENSLALLRTYFRLGVRYMTLTWTNTNEWADSSGDLDDASIQHHGGLTEFGRDVIREMNRLGMMIDISHVSDQTFWDVLRTTRAPVIASHSSARALCDLPRNMSDEMLRAVATSNGIVMVNFYAAFIDAAWRERWRATEAERHALTAAAAKSFRERGEPAPYSVSMDSDRSFYAERFAAHTPAPGVETLIDHIDHVAKVSGIDHVGIGSDFDGYSIGPRGMETAAQLPAITERLMARGYTAEQMQKILGGNLLRVMRAVEAEAATE
jgi:membrane dipeptidase